MGVDYHLKCLIIIFKVRAIAKVRSSSLQLKTEMKEIKRTNVYPYRNGRNKRIK